MPIRRRTEISSIRQMAPRRLPCSGAPSPSRVSPRPAAWSSRRGTRIQERSSFPSLQLTNAANDPGGLAEIDKTGNVLRTISFASLGVTSCSPAGLAVGSSGNLMVGCGNVGAAALLINPTGGTLHTGSLVTTVAGLGGTDELWFDPTTAEFYVTGNDGTNTTRFFDIVTDERRPFPDGRPAGHHECAFDHGRSVQRRCFRGACRHHYTGPLSNHVRESGLHRGIRTHCGARAWQPATPGGRIGRPDGPRGAPQI